MDANRVWVDSRLRFRIGLGVEGRVLSELGARGATALDVGTGRRGLGARVAVTRLGADDVRAFDLHQVSVESSRRALADLPFLGLIGSRTKWATFRRRLEARGFTPAELDAVVCPIGLPGIAGKEPEVIAVAVAAQLLQTLGSQGGA